MWFNLLEQMSKNDFVCRNYEIKVCICKIILMQIPRLGNHSYNLPQLITVVFLDFLSTANHHKQH